MLKLRSLPLCRVSCGVALALLCSLAVAQNAAPAVRIVSPIDANHLVILKGNVHPLANAANDRGAVSPDFALPDLTMVLSRSAEQQAAFDAYVESEYDPGSPNFHQWLEPNEVGERFGPSTTDIGTVSSWLASQGFTVTGVSPDRMNIHFSGTAGLVQNAFHTQIHTLSVKGEWHYANMSDPQIPAALSPVVLGVKGLHNFLPRPAHKVGALVRQDPATGKWQRIGTSPLTNAALSSSLSPSSAALAKGVRPELGYTGGSGSNTYLIEDVSPWDFAAIYNLPSGWPNTTTVNGTGQTIAIAGTSLVAATDVSAFRSAFSLPAGPTLQQIDTKAQGTTAIECTSTTAFCSQGDMLENSLDVEWSGAVAPGAQIDLVVTGQPTGCQSSGSGCIDTVYYSAQYVVTNKTANILSVSYGNCELGEGISGNVAYHDLWQTAASEGIAVFVASGDNGSPGCDANGQNSSVGWPNSAQGGLGVSGLASTAYNVAVGGTDFSWCKPAYNSSGAFTGCPTSMSSPGPYWSTNDNASQGNANANGYVPETPWNDSCMNPIWAAYIESIAPLVNLPTPANAEAACNFVLNNYVSIYTNNKVMLATLVDTSGGSGGASNCVANNSDTNNTNPTCTSGATSVADGAGSIPLTNGGWQKPSWQSGVPGIPSDGVRDLPDVSFFSGDGSLDSATLVCVAALPGSQPCSANSSGTTMQEVGGTSVATPEMAGVMALINQKAGSNQGLPNAQLYALAGKQNYSNCSAESVTAGSTSCYFNDIDTGNNSMPCDYTAYEGGAVYNSNTGTWQSVTPGSPVIQSPNCTPLNSGDAIGTLIVPGTYSTTAYNSGVGYDLATGLGSLNVANVVNGWTVVGTTTDAVTVTPGATSISYTQALSVTVAVAGGTPTGSVTLSASNGNYNASGTLSSGSYTFTIPANTFTTSGTVTLTSFYSGDGAHVTASGTATVTVAGPPTYVLKAISPASISSPGGSTTASTTVTSSGGYAGTVTLSCALTGAPSGAYTADNPTCSPSGTVTLSTSTTSGNVTLNIGTTAAVASLAYPKMGNDKRWLGAGSGAVLALLVFFGIPARRRSWRAMLGMVVLLVALGGLAACGGGGSGSTGGGGNSNPGTTAGIYTFTVTATGSPSQSPVPTQVFTVTVQ